MAEITAKLVNDLRARTGQGMMECKRMLTETAGDIEKAIDGFRKKGIKTSVSERAASEGRVAGAVSADGHRGALVEINCNTDFTAKSQPVRDLVQAAAELAVADAAADFAAAPAIAARVTEVAQQTGENVRIGRVQRLANPGGKIGLYLYSITGKIGVLVSVTGSASDELLRDLGVHITARKPLALALTRKDLPADIVAREKEIAVAQAMETGKPKEIAEKIAEGKMRTFYEERALLDQEFINPDKFKGSIDKLLTANKAKLEAYVRMELGQ